MTTPKISEFQKDVLILSGLLGLVIAIFILSYWYSYTPPPVVETEEEKPRKTFLVEEHVDDFKFGNLHHFDLDNDSMQGLIPQLTPVSHYWYGRVFQFDEMPGGKYKVGQAAPFLAPAQAYFFSHQTPIEMWTGYEYDWITLLFDPQPDSWQLISCFYNRTPPSNPKTPGDEKGILANFTFFPLAEYGKTEQKEWLRYSHWEDSTIVTSTLVESIEDSDSIIRDSSTTTYEMRVYAAPELAFYEHFRDGIPVSTIPPENLIY